MTETDFFEGGAKSLSRGKVNSDEAKAVFGKWRGGLIEHIGSERQKTNWETNELEFWGKSGDPVMQLPITVNTAAGQFPEVPIDAEDDLVRVMFITKGKQEFRAARDAFRKAGVKAPQVGGYLYERWYQGIGISGDPRLMEYTYYPPQGGADAFLNGGQPAAPPQPTAQPQGQHMPPQVPPSHQPAPGAYPQQPSGAYGSSASVAGHPGPDSYPAQQPAPGPQGGAVQPRFDPHTGQPVQQQAAAPEQPAFDPATGAPLNDAARAVLAQHTQPAAGPQQPPAAPMQQGAPTNPYAQ